MQPVVFFIGSSQFRQVTELVARLAHPYALRDSAVVVYSVPEASSLARRVVLAKALETQNSLNGKEPTIVVDKRLHIDRPDLVKSVRFNRDHVKFADVQLLLRPDKGTKLNYTSQLLKTSYLDVRGYAFTQIQHWKHATITIDHLNAWVAQFEALGASEALAEKLLKQIDMLPPQQLFASANSYVDKGDTLVVLQDPDYPGKSAAEVANILAGRFRENPMKAINVAIEEGAGKKIHVFEDGAWTATELVGIIESLLGKRKLRQKVPALSDPNKLGECEVHFHFHVTTDIARQVFDDLKRELSLSTIHLAGSPVNLVALASPFSASLPAKWYSEQTWPVDIIRPQFLANGANFDNVECDLIRVVGRQLWTNYLQEQVDGPRKWTMWDAPRIDESALGMRGLGMTMTFAHSAPKAMLPLFWGHGKVTVSGRQLDWLPLLPNAA